MTFQLIIQASELDRIHPDLEDRNETFWSRCRDAVVEEQRHIVGVKLRLPGLAVRKGGTPGPHGEGIPYSTPVLHRDSGDLAQSIDLNLSRAGHDRARRGNWVMVIGQESNVLYGLYHELGGPRVRTRPFMGPSADRLFSRVEEIIEEVYG